MNLANKLTMSRFVLAFFFMFFLYASFPHAKLLALLFFGVASITDYFDGMIAKKYNMETDFGRLMDPIADKVLVLAGFLAFVELSIIPAWMVVIVVARELLITGLRLVLLTKKKVLAASKAGKHKTVTQIVSISVILFYLCIKEFAIGNNLGWWNPGLDQILLKSIHILMLITIFFTVFSGASYLKNNIGSLK